MKEMVGGCCVCSDERGWPDNPLVYCDGNGCTVAVHQACYGIVTVPTGPWFCRKCESPERQAKVRCELCPSRSGALKKTDTGGWAHVVCALYIPEVRFGNVTSMEPIILQLIPQERFNKTCYICHDLGKVNRSTIGACMQCNKPGCKQQFHVTCAQGLGLLCEEAGNYLDNVKYCGYCQHHYSKLKKGGNVKTIPPYKPISADSQSSDSSPEKDGEVSPPSAGNIVPSGTSSNPLKGSISKMQSSRSKSTGYQSTSSKNGQSTIKTPVSSTSPSMGSAHGSSHIQPTSSKPVSSQQAPNTPAAKNSPTEGASAVPTSSSTIILASSSSSDMSSSPILPMNQKFTSSNFTEALITNSDSIFGGVPAEQKQTKKRKAIAQQASASASATYPHTNTASAPQVTDTGRSSGAWDTGHNNQPSVEHTPDSTNDKIKKIKTELPKVSVSQSSHQGSIQHEEMQPPSSHYTSTIQALPGSSGMSSNIQHAPSQHDRPGMSTSNIHYGPSSSHSQAIPTSSHIQGPKYSPSVGAEAHSLQQENPTSLLVSVPLNQGLNLTQQHLTNVDLPPPTRTARSPLIRMGNPMATAWNPPSQPGPSSSEQPSTSGEPKHSSMDKIPTVLSSTTRASVPPNVASGIIRNKKRAAMNPPSNIGADTRMKFARLERAPHMLGNELNPESAAAARLSEQLSAELAAHSVYHATPAPILVPPPLINRATNCTGVPRPIGSFANVPSGAQSLDQLLERQWEQGSQFLMEQAQHFDIASLLSCLHQLRTENVRLEEHVSNLLQRRDHLLAVNARLAIPLNTAVAGAATVENRVVRETGGSVRSSPVIRTETSVLTERPQQDILQYFHQRTPQGS